MSEETVLVPLGDREVEMRKPTEGALVVLARVYRGMPKIENAAESDVSQETRAKMIRSMGTLGSIVDAMIVSEEDRDWLEEAMISGEVPLEDVFDSIRVAGEKFNGSGSPAGPKKAAKTVRRRG